MQEVCRPVWQNQWQLFLYVRRNLSKDFVSIYTFICIYFSSYKSLFLPIKVVVYQWQVRVCARAHTHTHTQEGRLMAVCSLNIMDTNIQEGRNASLSLLLGCKVTSCTYSQLGKQELQRKKTIINCLHPSVIETVALGVIQVC